MPALQYNRRLAYFISTILFDGYLSAKVTMDSLSFHQRKKDHSPRFLLENGPNKCKYLYFLFLLHRTASFTIHIIKYYYLLWLMILLYLCCTFFSEMLSTLVK